MCAIHAPSAATAAAGEGAKLGKQDKLVEQMRARARARHARCARVLKREDDDRYHFFHLVHEPDPPTTQRTPVLSQLFSCPPPFFLLFLVLFSLRLSMMLTEFYKLTNEMNRLSDLCSVQGT